MRKRNVRIQFWLNKKEAEALQKKVKKSGLSREAYLRHLVNGLVPQEAPPPDYFSMMWELHQIGNNLNQIARKAHALQALDVQRYDVNLEKLETAIQKITEAVVLPQPMEKMGSPQSQKTLWGGEHPRSGESFAAGGGSGKRSAV